MTSLHTRLIQEISTNGPMPVVDYVTRCLWDPEYGYYAQKVPIGEKGDYITAPEMSQVFGEIIALWLIDAWTKAGSPVPFNLVEMGPGLGTMMADIVRIFVKVGVPLEAVHLIEKSEVLKGLQREKLKGIKVIHHEEVETLPECFTLLVGNEFWDALPVRQEVLVGGQWVERYVNVDGGELVFLPTYSAYPSPDSLRESTSPECILPLPLRERSTSEAVRVRGELIIHESSPYMPSIATKIATHLSNHNGVALFIDYGYDQSDATGDTLQALAKHQKTSPLSNPGQADLTHHVDFYRLKTIFREAGLQAHTISQGEFLTTHGFNERTEHLCRTATPAQQSALCTAAVRLTSPAQMGMLFKVLSVFSQKDA